MKQEDDDIKEFFDQLKKADANETEIPKFQLSEQKPKPSKLRYLIPLAVAASLLLFFGMDWNGPTEAEESATMVITMTVETSSGTDNFISEETSMSSWKSPSDILIQEFED